MRKVLVVGGAGYVGSSTCAWLLDRGDQVRVLDNLSTGHRELVLSSDFTLGRAGDAYLVAELLAREKFDCVMHFAARSLVEESVTQRELYFENNVEQTRQLIETILKAGVRNFIFSSTCAIFGDPGQALIDENLEKKPINPYGETKLAVEKMLAEFALKKGLKAIALRYFNAAGAEPSLRVGEWHEPESHLIPRVLEAARTGKSVEIFGTDYPTRDGTCVRDYIYVRDLAAAHGAAMDRLLGLNPTDGVFEAYNLGSEKGFSVREIVQECEKVTGKKLNVLEKPRRSADLPQLVADSSLAKKVLGFKTQQSSLSDILSSAWKWQEKKQSIVRKAVFLDRDGTLNEDPGYLNHPDQMKLLPNVGESLALLKKAGFLLVVVSNQSGVGRGLIQESELPKIHFKMNQLLAPWSASIHRFELCFHKPEDQCKCRKPQPKLLFDAAKALNIDLAQSYMVGDKLSDIEAGHLAHCKASILVRTGQGKETEKELKKNESAFTGDSLLDVARWILTQENVSF